VAHVSEWWTDDVRQLSACDRGHDRAMHAEPHDAPRPVVYRDEYPVRVQNGRFAPKQVHAPQTSFAWPRTLTTARLGRIRHAHKPAITRSRERRFGDRFRDRFKISSWCLTSIDSANAARGAAGPDKPDDGRRQLQKQNGQSRTARCYQQCGKDAERARICEFAMHRRAAGFIPALHAGSVESL